MGRTPIDLANNSTKYDLRHQIEVKELLINITRWRGITYALWLSDEMCPDKHNIIFLLPLDLLAHVNDFL
jgi:hypothetical protein